MFVLCSTLGRCWMFSWVRGETGECLWLCVGRRELLWSVPATEHEEAR